GGRGRRPAYRPSTPPPRRSAGRRPASSASAVPSPHGPRCARGHRVAPGTGTSCAPRRACGRSSPHRAHGRAGARGRRARCGRPPRRANRGNDFDRRAGRTREGRPDNYAACAARRLAPRRGGVETRPADPSCHRKLDLPFEVAPLARTVADGAVLEDTLGDECGATLRARLIDRPPPDQDLRVGICGAAEEGAALARPPLDELPGAAGLGARDAEGDRLGRLALGVAGARDEFTKAPVLDDHGLAARRAILVRRLVLGASAPVEVSGVPAIGIGGAGQELPEPPALLQKLALALRAGLTGGLADLLTAHLPLGASQVALEGLVERLHGVDPLALTLLDLVEVVFHLRRELDVHDVLEVRNELVGDRHAQLGRAQRAPLAMHVAAVVDDRAQDRRIGRRPADPELLERLDERGLRETGRRLREVLLRVERDERQHLALLEHRDRAFLALPGPGLAFLAALFVHGGEPLELERRPLGAEEALTGLDIRAHRIVTRGHHLACQEPLPDEPVELHLVRREVLLDDPGLVAELRRPDRLAGLLGAAPRLVGRRRLGDVLHADARDDPAARRGLRLARHPDRVGPHVSDETLGAFRPEVDALVELLGDRHRLARREAELAPRLLLQRRGDERRQRVAPALAARDRLDDEAHALERGHERARRLLVRKRCLLARDLLQGRDELGRPRGVEPRVERPVLDGDERLD